MFTPIAGLVATAWAVAVTVVLSVIAGRFVVEALILGMLSCGAPAWLYERVRSHRAG